VQALIVLLYWNSIYNNVGYNKHLYVCFYLVFRLISCDVEACIPVGENIDYCRGRRGRDRMVIGFKTTFASIASHH
jgi:hypothetical protein